MLRSFVATGTILSTPRTAATLAATVGFRFSPSKTGSSSSLLFQSSRSYLSTYEQHDQMASEIFTTAGEEKSRLIFLIKDMELDKELALKDKDLALRLAMKDQAHGFENKLKEKDIEIESKVAFYKKQLSFVSQRSVLESFFNHVVLLARDENSTVHKAVMEVVAKKLPVDKSIFFPNKKTGQFMTLSMTAVNLLLLIAEVKNAVWEELGIERECPFPTFDAGQFLYGLVSGAVHHPNLRQILVSDQADEKYVKFFEALAVMQNRKVCQFDEAMAALAEVKFMVDG